MTLSPDVKAFLASAGEEPKFPVGLGVDAERAWLAERRSAVPARRPPEPVGRTWDVLTGSEVRARVYLPADPGPHPLMVYLHGGGWVMGDLEMHDGTCRQFCNRLQCSVVNVDYRLAPEHPFPVPLDDAWEAVQWAVAHAPELKADPARLIVAGSSAGGNLAAAVALRARDQGGPEIALQLLIYPVLDPQCDTASYAEHGEGYLLDRDEMEFYWRSYVPDPDRRRDPYAAPSASEALEGLPPAIVASAEYDPLRDEAEAYARRLQDAGVPTVLRRFDGQIHGFLTLMATGSAVDELARLVSERIS